jgi:methyl-accepting chemotaxis protein
MRLFSYKGLGIARRLHLVSAALSLAFAGVAGFAYLNLGHVSQLAHQTASVRVPQLQRVSTTELEVTRVLLLLRQSILARSDRELRRQLDGIQDKRRQIDAAMQDYRQALRTDAERQRYARVPPLLETFWAVAAEDTRLILAGQKEEALAYLMDKTVPARTELLAALRDAVKLQHGALATELDAVVAEAQRTLTALLLLAASSIAGLALLSWHVACVLGRRVAAARAVAERVRDGDLTVAVQDGGRDEFSPLLAALDEMQAALTRVVSKVRSDSDRVATASAHIAQGSQALSARTEQQASALQQTAATMEQLGATVRTNAGNAMQARALAAGASSIAARGGAAVHRVVQTMQGIQDSATRIADITSVIDGIALQTNLLALNAAVEAARAGEQGRGFAVVASEVRSLAQRSAVAAHQIKELITTSVAQAEQGSTLVGEAGATMADIVAAIGRVSAIVAEISVASNAQSSSVGQIGQAVAQMDEVTQQNAVLVDQSATAAASLKGQAAQLVQAVAVFRHAAPA